MAQADSFKFNAESQVVFGLKLAAQNGGSDVTEFGFATAYAQSWAAADEMTDKLLTDIDAQLNALHPGRGKLR